MGNLHTRVLAWISKLDGQESKFCKKKLGILSFKGGQNILGLQP